MAYVADFDPSGFDQLDTLTWPVPAPYSPGDWWYVTAPGVVNGTAVDTGDRVYPVGTGRLYGELDYGDDVYGGPVAAPPWPADPFRTRWRATVNSAPAWDRPPPPYAGCPFAAPGWRIVLEVLYNSDPATRTYGMGLYGDDIYGSVNGLDLEWIDITPSSFGLVVRRGGEDGAPVVDVEQLAADLRDLDASLFPMIPGASTGDGILREPTVSTPIRISVLDPTGEPHPIFAGRIELIGDEHDRGVRLLTLDAFGFIGDLATSVIMLQRSEESASSRLGNLLARAAWQWGKLAYPSVGATLRRIELIDQANVRQEADRAAISSSWSVGTDVWGRLSVREWPFSPVGSPIIVTDARGATGLASPRMTYATDTGELLNAAIASSESVQGSAELTAQSIVHPSIGTFGRSSDTLGFPFEGLSAQQAELEQLVNNATARYSGVVTRCVSVEADSMLDRRWVDVLANLELGAYIRTVRSKPVPLVLDHVLVGIEHRMIRDRWAATLYLTTLTETI